MSQVVNDTSDSHLKNTAMAANAFEQKVSPAVGAGREHVAGAGQNDGGFEQRAGQEQGQH